MTIMIDRDTAHTIAHQRLTQLLEKSPPPMDGTRLSIIGRCVHAMDSRRLTGNPRSGLIDAVHSAFAVIISIFIANVLLTAIQCKDRIWPDYFREQIVYTRMHCVYNSGPSSYGTSHDNAHGLNALAVPVGGRVITPTLCPSCRERAIRKNEDPVTRQWSLEIFES